MTIHDADALDERLTYEVPEAGKKAGMGKNGSYAAAKSGAMPTIRINGRLKVPKKKWDAILNGEAV